MIQREKCGLAHNFLDQLFLIHLQQYCFFKNLNVRKDCFHYFLYIYIVYVGLERNSTYQPLFILKYNNCQRKQLICVIQNIIQLSIKKVNQIKIWDQFFAKKGVLKQKNNQIFQIKLFVQSQMKRQLLIQTRKIRSLILKYLRLAKKCQIIKTLSFLNLFQKNLSLMTKAQLTQLKFYLNVKNQLAQNQIQGNLLDLIFINTNLCLE
ncbi:hypothetical protein TTHERM_000656208 (macronuclear) [Tetrahymena thermophila SB210]|uniref:Uncharacterized protein n=1 Tax=Tetrahymena thermophila (strain SB210) TaxID=312017 RepID=W7XEM1_TETTS|nr:hypothetical protein TTHERM_000656208 [Tetrahymena thermophila SB210]EWS72321.1 hypothetical protein TTHERM_000656208 [Tetrahymena thermophila SB210]|eukprot:XP_012655155.1 hypothetical protein TTHERM_000656208 [Tetrahymena thermophila SB210]